MIKVKGVSLSSSLKSNESTFGKESYKKLIDSMSEEDKKILTGVVLDVSWYPLDLLVRFMEASFKHNYNSNVDLYKKSVHMVTEQHLKGTYSAFLSYGSAENIVEHLGPITNRYFDGITVEVEKIEEGKVKIFYKGFEKQHAFYELPIQAWWEKVLDMLGIVKNIKVEITTPIKSGKGFLEYLISWEKK